MAAWFQGEGWWAECFHVSWISKTLNSARIARRNCECDAASTFLSSKSEPREAKRSPEGSAVKSAKLFQSEQTRPHFTVRRNGDWARAQTSGPTNGRRVLGQHRSTQRKIARTPDDEAALITDITALALRNAAPGGLDPERETSRTRSALA